MKTISSVAAVAFLACAAAADARADLVQDGGFEAAIANNPVTNLGDGWTASSGFAYVSSSAAGFGDAHTGNFFLNLSFNNPTNTVQQTLATIAGDTYTLTFWVASDVPLQVLDVKFGTSDVFNSAITVTGLKSNDYIEEQLTLTALSSGSVLSFSTRFQGPFAGNGINLDDVSVVPFVPTPTPEPTTLALLGAGLAGLGFARRRKA